MIAAHESEHEGIVFILEGDRLDCLFERHAQEVGHKLDGLAGGRLGLLQRLRLFLGSVDGKKLRLFHVRRVVARRAAGNFRLTGGSEHRELMRVIAADRTRVRLDGTELQAAAREDVCIGVVHLLVGNVSTRLVLIKGIEILHDELAAAHESEARTNLVAILVLNLVQKERQLLVGAHLIAHERRDHLLVRRAETEFTAMAVLQAKHLLSEYAPTPRLLPDLRRLHDRHAQLLPARRIHLLADDLLDLLYRAPRQRQIRIDTARRLTDHSRAQHETMTRDLSVGRHLAQRRRV